MAFKMTKQEVAVIDARVLIVIETRVAMKEAISDYNRAAKELFEDKIRSKLIAYNDALEELKGEGESFAERLRSEHGDKSDRWQESPKGLAVEELAGEWEEWVGEDPLAEVVLDEPEDIELDHLDDNPNDDMPRKELDDAG